MLNHPHSKRNPAHLASPPMELESHPPNSPPSRYSFDSTNYFRVSTFLLHWNPFSSFTEILLIIHLSRLTSAKKNRQEIWFKIRHSWKSVEIAKPHNRTSESVSWPFFSMFLTISRLIGVVRFSRSIRWYNESTSIHAKPFRQNRTRRRKLRDQLHCQRRPRTQSYLDQKWKSKYPKYRVLWNIGCVIHEPCFFSQPLTSSEAVDLKYRNGIATLKIGEIFPEDEGEYVCTATNSQGSVETRCKLSVKCKGNFCSKLLWVWGIWF